MKACIWCWALKLFTARMTYNFAWHNFHTVNSTVNNFYPFGVSVGDVQFPTVDDGTSGPITLSTQIRFFETSESTLYVS